MNGIDSNFDSKNKNKKTTQELFLGVCDVRFKIYKMKIIRFFFKL